MTQQTRIIENRIKWSQDQASAQAAIVANKQIAQSFEAISIASKQFALGQAQINELVAAASANAGLNAQQTQALAQQYGLLASSEQQVTVATDTQAKSVGILAQRYLDVKAAAEQARNAEVLASQPSQASLTGGGAAVSGGGGSLSGARGALRAGGFLLGAEAGGGALRAVGQVITLTTVLGPFGVAAGIGIEALRAVTDAETKRAEAAQKAADILKELTGAGAGGDTSADINKRIEAQTRQRDALLEVQNALNVQADAVTNLNFAYSQGAFSAEEYKTRLVAIGNETDALTGGAVTAAGGMLDLNKLLEDNKQSITDANSAIALYNAELNTSSVAANDAAAAEEELRKAREVSAKQLIDQFQKESDLRLQLADLRRNGTSEQLQAFLQSNSDQINIIRNFLLPAVQTMGLTTEAATQKVQELNAQLVYLEHANTLAIAATKGVIEAREREAATAQALIDRSDAVNDALKEMRDAQTALADASKKSAETNAALVEGERDHARNLRGIETDTNDKIADIRRKAGEKLIDIDAKSAERLLQQRENDNLSIEAAVARGDIAAAQGILAQQSVRIEQERRNVETQKQDAAKNAQDQIAAANEQAKKLYDAEAERYAKEYQQRADAHREALEQERAALNAENALRQTQAFTIAYWNGVVSKSTGDFSQAAYDAAGRINQAVGLLRSTAINTSGFPRQTTPVSIAQFAAGYTPPEFSSSGYRYLGSSPGAYSQFGVFDTPSYNTRPGIYRSNVPEYHIPAADFHRMGGVGGSSLTVNVDARGATMDASEYRRITREEIVPIVEKKNIELVQVLATANRSVKRGK